MKRDLLNTPLRIWYVDVFTSAQFCGNPAAVVFDAERFSQDQMQAIARETNLSETVFLLRPASGADVGVRIFTPRYEITFAVHPVIAAAHALAEAASTPIPERLVMSCNEGNIILTANKGTWYVHMPNPASVNSQITSAQIAPMLNLSVGQLVSQEPLAIWGAGPRWLIAEVDSSESLGAIRPDHAALAKITGPKMEAVGLTVFARTPQAPDAVELRVFAPGFGIFEDPVSGSSAAALAAMFSQKEPSFAMQAPVSFKQGASVFRPGRMIVCRSSAGISVGGRSVTSMRGHLVKGDTACHA